MEPLHRVFQRDGGECGDGFADSTPRDRTNHSLLFSVQIYLANQASSSLFPSLRETVGLSLLLHIISNRFFRFPSRRDISLLLHSLFI